MTQLTSLLAQRTPQEIEPGLALFSLLVFVGVLIGWAIFLIAAWRAMKAHESIARSIERAANAHEAMAYTTAQGHGPAAYPTSAPRNI